MQQVLEKAGGFFDQKARFGDVTMENYDRSFGIDVDTSLLEGGVSHTDLAVVPLEFMRLCQNPPEY
jgi:hypothetical protein